MLILYPFNKNPIYIIKECMKKNSIPLIIPQFMVRIYSLIKPPNVIKECKNKKPPTHFSNDKLNDFQMVSSRKTK